MRTFGFIFAALLCSCTSFIIETEPSIQMENKTDAPISNLCLVSSKGNIRVLIPETVEAGKRSGRHDNQLVGKFTFAVFVADTIKHLGVHELKGGTVFDIGTVLVIINKDFTMEIK